MRNRVILNQAPGPVAVRRCPGPVVGVLQHDGSTMIPGLADDVIAAAMARAEQGAWRPGDERS